MTTTIPEQETIITQNRADDYVSIYSSSTPDIAYFNKRDEFTLVQEWRNADTGEIEAAQWALPNDRANIRKIVKTQRAPLTEEQRVKVAERLKRGRKLQ